MAISPARVGVASEPHDLGSGRPPGPPRVRSSRAGAGQRAAPAGAGRGRSPGHAVIVIPGWRPVAAPGWRAGERPAPPMSGATTLWCGEVARAAPSRRPAGRCGSAGGTGPVTCGPGGRVGGKPVRVNPLALVSTVTPLMVAVFKQIQVDGPGRGQQPGPPSRNPSRWNWRDDWTGSRRRGSPRHLPAGPACRDCISGPGTGSHAHLRLADPHGHAGCDQRHQRDVLVIDQQRDQRVV